MTRKKSAGAGGKAQPLPSFDPVRVRARHDGWTAQRQVDFIHALAECGCVRDACRRVGMSAETAYALVRRPDAQSFRIAWGIALDNAVRRIADEAFSRCIHGVAVPHFYKGERVGEHRRYNDGLAMFLLRYRDPARYGRHLDAMAYGHHPERTALALGEAIEWAGRDARRAAAGLPRTTIARWAEDADGWRDLGDGARRDGDDPEEEAFAPDAASGLSGSGESFPAGGTRLGVGP